jgi:hypothetical protein
MKPAPVRFLGYQEGIPGKVEGAYLYNLTEAIPGHPVGDTLTEKTLNAAGYFIPRDHQPCSECQGTLSAHGRGCTWPE